LGTFHHDRHELHGITVVVETDGAELWVGRCDDIDSRGVILRDADVHREGESPASRAEWLGAARKVGVWPRHRRTVIPAERVAAVRRLAEG
jgi:hypothetical protein